MMQYIAVDSSIIDLIGYDEDTQILEVRFVNTGYTYGYVQKKNTKKIVKIGTILSH